MNFGIASQGTGNGTETRKEQRRQFLMAAGGAALALMVAASLGAWKARQHTGGGTTGVGVSEGGLRDAISGHTDMGDSLAEWIAVQQRLGAQVGAGTTGTVADPATILAGSAGVAVAPALYIVATEAEAAEVWAGIAMFGSMARQHEVLVLDPSKDDGQILRGLGHMNDERSLQGLPPIELVDLRPATAGSTDATATLAPR